MKNWSFERVLLVLAVVVVIGQSIYIFFAVRKQEKTLQEAIERNQRAVLVIDREMVGLEKERALDSLKIDSLIREKIKQDESRENLPNTNFDVMELEEYFTKRYGTDSD